MSENSVQPKRFPLDVRELERKINYTFADRALLKNALCHSSYSNERKMENIPSNERLEFLGDSVLSIIASEYLYRSFPERPEGELSKIRREIVDSEALASFAREIELGNYMSFGKGEEKNGGRDRTSNLEDAFEALAAALYLDGGLETVKKFFVPFVEKAVESAHENDPKSLLQEIAQAQEDGVTPKYEKIEESGPDHDKRFVCVVKLDGNIFGRGEGRRIQEAEMNAARDALRLLGEQVGE